MKRIAEYRKLMEVEPNFDLGVLKTVYRNKMKEFHPDKFVEEAEKEEAEVKSKTIIEAYHFLVSIAPETVESNLEDYNNTINNSLIDDFQYKGQTLKITFLDGSMYEYYGVPKNIFNKFANSLTLTRFAKRHIFFSYTYRNVLKANSLN